jgi:dihydroorotate dehydrogenase
MASLRLVVRPSRIIRVIRPPPLSFRSFTSAYAPEPTSTFRRAAYGTLFALSAAVGVVYYVDSRAAIHRYLITPLIRNALDPESAHMLAVSVLENGLGPRDMLPDDERLETEVKGHQCRALYTDAFIVFSSGIERYQTPSVSQLGLTKTVEQLMV